MVGVVEVWAEREEPSAASAPRMRGWMRNIKEQNRWKRRGELGLMDASLRCRILAGPQCTLPHGHRQGLSQFTVRICDSVANRRDSLGRYQIGVRKATRRIRPSALRDWMREREGASDIADW